VNESLKTTNTKAFKGMLSSITGSGGKAALQGDYQLHTPKPVEGSWYYTVLCNKCTKPTPLVEDPSSGSDGEKFTGPGGIVADCYNCGTTNRAEPAHIISRKWPQHGA
jgi:hypothetical protein